MTLYRWLTRLRDQDGSIKMVLVVQGVATTVGFYEVVDLTAAELDAADNWEGWVPYLSGFLNTEYNETLFTELGESLTQET